MISLSAPSRRPLKVANASSNSVSGKVWVQLLDPNAAIGHQWDDVSHLPALTRTPKVPEPERTLPEATQGDDRAVLQVVLVGAEKGIVRGVRSLTLSPEFTRALQGAIRPRRRQPGPAMMPTTLRFRPSTAGFRALARCWSWRRR
jgi:hypothetical protein